MKFASFSKDILCTLDSLEKKDATMERESLVKSYFSKRPILNSVYFLSQILSSFTLGRFFLLVGVFIFRIPRHNKYHLQHQTIFLYKNNNEKKALLLWSLDAQALHLQIDFVDVLRNIVSAFSRLFLLRKVYTQFLQKRAKGKVPVYIFLRQCEMLCWLLYWEKKLHESSVQTLIVSTDGNPHGLAIFIVAQILKKKSIFATHACLPLNAAPFTATIALLYGPAAQELYLKNGCAFQEIKFLNSTRKLPTSFLPRAPRILIACSKVLRWEQLQPYMQSLANCKFFLRPHPNHVDKKESYASLGIPLLTMEAIDQCLSTIDLVWGGNSNLHLDCFLQGKPTFFLPEIELVTEPQLPFVNGLIPRWQKNISIQGNVDHFCNLASQPNWLQEMGHFLQFTKEILNE